MAKLEIKWLCSENFPSSDMNRDFFIGWYLAETRGLPFRNTIIFLRNLKAIEKVIWSLIWGFFFWLKSSVFFYIVVKISWPDLSLAFLHWDQTLFPPSVPSSRLYRIISDSKFMELFSQFRTVRAYLKHFSQFSQPAWGKMICKLVKHHFLTDFVKGWWSWEVLLSGNLLLFRWVCYCWEL